MSHAPSLKSARMSQVGRVLWLFGTDGPVSDWNCTIKKGDEMNEKLYYSNGGRGHYVCRVVDRYPNGILLLQRAAKATSKHWETFTLPERYFFSRQCGWKARAALNQTAERR
jgi:hypothetical protein